MVKRKQERIFSRLFKEIEPGFSPKKEDLKDLRINIEECYRILCITPDASLYEIKQAYRDLATVWHPDKYLNNQRIRDKAEKQLKKINMAYDILFQLFSDREQASKEQEDKEQEERQRQKQRRAKQESQENGQRERLTGRGSLTVLKCDSRVFWWSK